MFNGEYIRKIERVGGRIVIPAKFRRKIEGSVVVKKSPDGCLIIYQAKGEKDGFRRRFPGSISRPIRRQIDCQGRIELPPALREFAGLKNKVNLIGCGSYIEIWDTTRYNLVAKGTP